MVKCWCFGLAHDACLKMGYPKFDGRPSFSDTPIPIGSMYGIYANIWGILMVNVTICGIHGSYGIWED